MQHKVNDIISMLKYAKVLAVNKESMSVQDLHTGEKILIVGDVRNTLQSADHSDENQKCTRTELATILSEAWCTPFTVTFTKSDGEERVLRGRLIEPNTLLGRSLVEDLDKDASDRICQVDHRTISSIIVGNKHYSLRK